MSRKFLVPIDLSQLELLNARIQNLAAAPSTPVVGQFYYDTSTGKLGYFNGSIWVYLGTSDAVGDVQSNTTTSVDGEVVLFSGTNGKVIKRATGTGIAKLTNGVLSANGAFADLTDAFLNGLGADDFLRWNGTAWENTRIQPNDVPDIDNLNGGLGSDRVTNESTVTGANVSDALETLATDIGTSANDIDQLQSDLSDVEGDITTLQTQKADITYVDSLVQGLSWKQAVKASTTTNITLSGTQTVDGVALIAGDRVLVKDQSTGSQNGIYIVASGAWTRATDANTSGELDGATVYTTNGTVNSETVWTQTIDNPTLGSTSLVFAQVNGGSVPVASTTVQGKVELATQAETEAKTDSTRAVTPVSLTSFARKYTGTIGNGSSTALAVTHGLGSQYVTAQVFEVSTGNQVECDVSLTSSTQTTFTFAVAPTTNQYRVVITG